MTTFNSDFKPEPGDYCVPEPDEKTATSISTCPHCGLAAHPVTQCPRVAAVEFRQDGTIRRVEYVPPQPLTVSANPKPTWGPAELKEYEPWPSR